MTQHATPDPVADYLAGLDASLVGKTLDEQQAKVMNEIKRFERADVDLAQWAVSDGDESRRPCPYDALQLSRILNGLWSRHMTLRISLTKARVAQIKAENIDTAAHVLARSEHLYAERVAFIAHCGLCKASRMTPAEVLELASAHVAQWEKIRETASFCFVTYAKARELKRAAEIRAAQEAPAFIAAVAALAKARGEA